MKIKSKLFYKIVAVLSIIMMVTVATPINAKLKEDDKIIKLTKVQATESALKNSVGMQRIDTGLDTILRRLKETHDLSDSVKKLEESLNTFKAIGQKYLKLKESPEFKKYMYLKGIEAKIMELVKNLTPDNLLKIQQLKQEAAQNALSPQEQANLGKMMPTKKEEATFNALKTELEDLLGTGFMDRKMSKKDEYEMIVKPRDVYWYQVEGKLRSTKLLKESSKKKIKLGVNELYNGIVQMQEGYEVKQKLYDKQTKEYDQMIIRRKVGNASELEKTVAEVELKKLSFQLNGMERQIDNLEIQLKKLMGISMTQKIDLTDKNTDADNIRDVKDYDYYLKNALLNRSEINTAKIDLDVNQWEFDKMEDYLYDDDYEYKEMEERLDESKMAIDDATNDVNKNIEFAYMDVMQKRHGIELVRQKQNEMTVQYDAAYNGYKAGIKPLSLTWMVELGKAKVELDLKMAIMNYNNATLKLEAASTVGPKYETRGGAK